jgi:hypothetical protein
MSSEARVSALEARAQTARATVADIERREVSGSMGAQRAHADAIVE